MGVLNIHPRKNQQELQAFGLSNNQTYNLQ